MSTLKVRPGKFVEAITPWLVLAILLSYTYAKFLQHPYGFWWNPEGVIESVFVSEPEPTLEPGDRLVQIGSLSWDAFNHDLRRTFFEGVQPGETAPVVVERGGQQLTIQWRLPGPNRGEFLDQLLSEWFLAYIFWMTGMATLLVVRPKDDRWHLMAAFNFMTSIWLMAGSGLSTFHIWYSALVLRMTVWMSVPIYLRMHWVFPRPLGNMPRWVIASLYLAAFILGVAQCYQLVPEGFFFVGFLVGILGSILLLVLHAAWQPETRRDLRLILYGAILALAPSVFMGVIGSINSVSPPGASLAFLSLPLLPLAYLYAASRGQLSGVEVRVNRLISTYLFLILLGMAGIPLLALADRLTSPSPDHILILGAVFALAVSVLSIWAFPPFQNFVERRWLGIPLQVNELTAVYSTGTSSSTSTTELVRMLEEEVIPSLLVRQFAFIQYDGQRPNVLLAMGVDRDQVLPEAPALKSLGLETGTFDPVIKPGEFPIPWVQLVLPLKVGSEVIGLWLFGRRDPDDVYPAQELPLLQSLANQTAIALSNILQTDRLKLMYKANVDGYEDERLRLSHELHDSVLNQLAVVRTNLAPDAVSPGMQNAYEIVTQRLREIVSDLRPPMLNYGLKAALEELADNLMERSRDTVEVKVDLRGDGERFPLPIEQHIFRIMQEGCENALRHAHARRITISGQLDRGRIELNLADDGVGFEMNEGFKLEALLVNKHFGLAGMLERAELIGAEIQLESSPRTGTRLRLRWKPGETGTSGAG